MNVTEEWSQFSCLMVDHDKSDWVRIGQNLLLFLQLINFVQYLKKKYHDPSAIIYMVIGAASSSLADST